MGGAMLRKRAESFGTDRPYGGRPIASTKTCVKELLTGS